MGFRYYVKPFKMELQSHHHDVDEYVFSLGAQLPDLTANFDAEIEIFLGPEYEKHMITKPCILYIPNEALPQTDKAWIIMAPFAGS
jgi:hypothetical protein